MRVRRGTFECVETYLEHGDRFLEEGLFVLTSASQGLNTPAKLPSVLIERGKVWASNIPERAETERALLATDAVVGLGDVVPVDKALSSHLIQHGRTNTKQGSEELTFDVKPPLSGVNIIFFNVDKNLGSDYIPRQHTRIPPPTQLSRENHTTTHRRREEHQRHDQQRRVQDVLVLIRLSEELQFGVPRLLHDLFVELVSGCKPLHALGAGEGSFVSEADAWVGGGPG